MICELVTVAACDWCSDKHFLINNDHSRSERFCWWLFLQRLKYNFLQFRNQKYIKILLFFGPNFVYIYIIYIFYYPKKGHWGRSFLVRGSWNGVCLWTNFSGIETHKLAEMTFTLLLILNNLSLNLSGGNKSFTLFFTFLSFFILVKQRNSFMPFESARDRAQNDSWMFRKRPVDLSRPRGLRYSPAEWLQNYNNLIIIFILDESGDLTFRDTRLYLQK